jgi:nitroreductase
MTMEPSALIDALNWRYATKQFDPQRRIDAPSWAALLESLRLAPSSFGIQPWRFIVVENPELRARLMAVSWNQRQVVDASHLVVFTYRQGLDAAHINAYMQSTAAIRGTTVEAMEPFRKVIMQSVDGARAAGYLDTWQSRQVYIALGQFMAAAAVLGIDTCPLEGLEPARYDEILQLAGSGYTTLCACAVGFRAADDKYAATPKVRFPAEAVIQYL